MKEHRCPKCNCEMKSGENWVEFNGELRHVEYLYCSRCYAFYNLQNELVTESIQNFRLTFSHK